MQKFLQFSLLATALIISACSKDEDYDRTKAVSAFATIDHVKVDSALENTEVKLPPQQKNNFWGGSRGQQNQEIENFEKEFSLNEGKGILLKKSSKDWFFYSGDSDDHFVFSPIVKDGKIFALDPTEVLAARDLASGKKIWKTKLFPKTYLQNYRSPKISYAAGKIFAIGGVNKIAAVNEVDGKILWTKDISSIPVSSPISDGKLVYVTTNNNKLYAFNAEKGELEWVHSGILRPTAIFGAAEPVLYKDLVITSYSSGEIYALKRKTGEAVWSQDLNLSRAINSDFYLNDIDATPIVKDDVIYAIGNGGLMMAINSTNGNYLWRKEIAGIVNFWAAGEFLFVINNDNKLLAIHKKSGGIKWISQLPNFKKENKPTTKIIYSGVIMAGDKLLISRVDGQLLIVSPIDGKIETNFEVGKKIYHSPLVVDGKIYLHTIGRYTAELLEIE